MSENALVPAAPRFGSHGRILHVDLGEQRHWVEHVEEAVYRQFLGGYGLGAWLMWKHYPAGTDALAPEACFAICSGLLTGVKTPFSGRIQIVGKSPLTGTWADSNSGGSVAAHLRAAGYDALVVRGKAAAPTLLVIQDDEVRFEPAGELWGKQVPETFDDLKARFGGKRDVGVSAIGPAGERGARIASVMNDRYHAFGRQGFGAVYGSKQLKAIVVGGSGEVPVHDERAFRALCKQITDDYRRDVGWFMRLFAWVAKPKKWLSWMYRLMPRRRMKITAPVRAMRQLWSQRGTTAAVSLSVENGDAPVKNWKGVGSRDFPLRTHSSKLDGKEVDRYITKKLSCGDCPMPCKGIVKVKARGLSDVRRPDYETIVGFGANLLNDDLELVTACHDACNRYGIDAVSSSATLAWACEAVERGDLTVDDLDGVDLRWGNGEAALALTIKMGERDGCGAWLADGVQRAAAHLGKGSDAYAVHVHGQEPAYHDPRFTSLMGVTYIGDPTPGRHTAGSASWNETFGVGFTLPAAVDKKTWNVSWKEDAGKGAAQAHFSNAHQAMNGLGLCMFTMLTGNLPWADLVNALTGWGVTDDELLVCGERIQNLRAAFNRREGLRPADFTAHPRMMGEGDGNLTAGPLKGVRVALPVLRDDYYRAMTWDPTTGDVSATRARELGIDGLLEGFVGS
ncbi:MAG: aldehyde ferredoxin oxidoreductase family protein [Kofleriaceae bacterium]|nr:aldehyde ferredoxin oxidoreductase family protein [Myxococcales bacterium]MCB9565211.1 aldehyde ferredoxin oxidoreductase family protein [Kofleriaceae bacterium]MCB9573348.1 aldehyde ferredoxin oxidoreductase family protein [Kofleriaceae bacterium]